MANSKYNQIMFLVAEDLGKLVSGEVANVDLTNFRVVGTRKTWSDSAEVLVDSEGKAHVVKTINAHMVAIGDVLASLGYKGPFHLSSDLKLSLTKAQKEVTATVTLADIIAKINAAKVAVTEPVIETTEHATE